MALSQEATLIEALNALKDYTGVNQREEFVNTINGIITANSDVVKNKMIAALNSKLGTSFTAANSWINIIDGLNSKPTLKGFAKGTVTIPPDAITANYFLIDGSYTGMYHAIVSGLTFKPTTVILKCKSGTSEIASIYEEISGGLWPKSIKATSFGNASAGVNTYHFKGDVYPVSVTATGFTLPVLGNGRTYDWIAYE